MQLIYDNMTRLFDAFTQGVLVGQGSNSEILFRNIYRSLDKDFAKIVQNKDAVDKIVEIIKKKQGTITADNVDSAMVSETTKKVVTKTLDPLNYDQYQV